MMLPLARPSSALRSGSAPVLARFLSVRAARDPARDAVIVSAVRTPIGSMNGSLSSLSAVTLGSIAIRAAVEKAGITASDVQEAYLGNVLGACEGQAPATQAILGAGLPNSIPATSVNKVCASGTKALMFASQAIMLGTHNCVVAGGFESMSNVPYYIPKGRHGYRLGHGEFLDGILKDGLTDGLSGRHMGLSGEDCAKKYGFTRADQDAYAAESFQRAVRAQKEGLFANEIIPVTIPGRNGSVTVSVDENPGRCDISKIPSARAAFEKNGTITAANASTINDGASMLIVTSMEKANRAGLKPLARIVGFGDANTDPNEFTVAPALAIPKVLKQNGLTVNDIDYWEINEAFSVVSLVNMKILGLDHSRVNVNGGAVALGHPIGCSGARIVTTLINVLQQKNATLGMVGICNGGGGAASLIVERLS